jgi:integrase
MPRRIRSSHLETRAARLRLPVSGKPWWQRLDGQLHLGYRRNKTGGQWCRRLYLGGQKYDVQSFAAADDHTEANGVSVLTWDQAQKRARELRDEFEQRQNGAAPLTVELACREYVADLRARKGETAASGADGRLRKHLLPVLGDHQLAELTAADLTAWRNGLVRASCATDGGDDEEEIRKSRDTANRMLSIAKAAFNLAFNGGKVASDHAWRRVKTFHGVGEARKVILTDDQQQNLIDACEPGLREFALLVAWTGARPGRELTEARVRDLDLEEETLAVSGKTGAREIHLPADALALLRRLALGKRPNEYLLTTADGGPWTKSLHDRRVEAAVAKAGLDPDTTLYALRHSYISGALKKGVPTKAVADHCGTSEAMIQRYYGKFIPSDRKRYAVMAAPSLRVEPADQKVVVIRKVS